MSEFSVNTDRIARFADVLESQAKILENAADSTQTVGKNLCMQGISNLSLKSSVRSIGTSVMKEATTARRLGAVLYEIAETYRKAENTILGSASGFSGEACTSGGTLRLDALKAEGLRFTNGSSSASALYSSDPVNLNTGNFILDNHDMEIPGYLPLSLDRFYNSMGTSGGMLGRNWNSCFERKLTENPSYAPGRAGASVMLEDGREEYFTLAGNGRYYPASGTTASLVHTEKGFIYQTLNGDCCCFDEDGRFVRFEDSHQNGFFLIYREGRLERVEKDSGEYFDFYYRDGNLLESVRDHTGRTCRYFFEGDCLKKAELPDGSTYQYTYNQYGKICRVINPRQIGAVETEYDEKQRVVFQRFADGTTNAFEYREEERSVIMTERNGVRSIHIHDEQYQNIRNVYPDGEEYFEYNERGQKTVLTDRLGNVTRLQYDRRGNITTILTADRSRICATYNDQNRLLTLSVNGKKRVRNIYNAFGDLVSCENALGEKKEYSYDGQGRTTQIRLPDDTEVKASYDDRGNLCMLRSANDGVMRFEYDALNRKISQTDANGNRSGYEYDVMGRLTSEIRPDGHRKQYRYDRGGNLIREENFDGSALTAVYNENNRLVSVTDSADRRTSFEYDPMWNLTVVTLPDGSAFRCRYNENGCVESICDAEGNETYYTFDAMGNMLSRTDAAGAVTGFVWDAMGRCTRVTGPDGAATEYQYNADGQVIYEKAADGTECFRSFDEAGRLSSETDSFGHVNYYTWNSAGLITAVMDENDRCIRYQYAKGLDRPEMIQYPDGTRETFSYDRNGNLICFTDIYGVTVHYQYDELNRPTALVTERGDRMEFVYDLLGRVVSEKDFEGNIIKYEYSVTGQLLSVTDALGHITRYSYDVMNRLTEVMREAPDAGLVRIAYERDRMGRLTKLTDASGKTEEYRYDGLGQMTEKKDRAGMITKYAYNRSGLLRMIQWADGKEASYRYYPSGRLSEVDDWTGVTGIEYGDSGNVTEIRYPDGRTLRMDYDLQGNRVSARYPDGRMAEYEYDIWNRLTKMTQDGFASSYVYDDMGRILSRSLSGGINIRYQYNEAGMPARMTCSDTMGILDDISYGYDTSGRRIQSDIFHRDNTLQNGSWSYAYDPVGRLSRVYRDGQLLREYGYDALGNRRFILRCLPGKNSYELTKYAYDRRGGLLKSIRFAVSDENRGFACSCPDPAWEGLFERCENPEYSAGDPASCLMEEYRYDCRGNLTEIIRNGRTVNSYQYDAGNRLSLAETANGDVAVYEYNGLGYRIGMRQASDGEKQEVSYILDYSRIYDNLIERRGPEETEVYFWGNSLEGFAVGSDIHGWYLTDVQGNVLRRTNKCTEQGGEMLYLGRYDEFGSPAVESSPEKKEHEGLYLENPEPAEEFGYSGFRYDPTAGTWFAQARQYRGDTGMFDAMDHFGGDITMPDTLNPYSYCIQDPLNHTDKSAYWFVADDAIAAVIGGAGGFAGQAVSDVIESVTTGQFTHSGWETYVSATAGGAAGGVTMLYAGPIAGGAVCGAVSALTSEGLTYLLNPGSYTKSLIDVTKEAAFNAGMGGLTGAVSGAIGKAVRKLANTQTVQNIISKMQNGGKAAGLAANYMNGISGRTTRAWADMTGLLKNYHGEISSSSSLQASMESFMIENLPLYLKEEVTNRVAGRFRPTGILTGLGRSRLSSWLRNRLGLSDSSDSMNLCAAAS